MKQVLCNQCAAKIRLNFRQQELVSVSSGMRTDTCEVCRKRRFCGEYEWNSSKPKME